MNPYQSPKSEPKEPEIDLKNKDNSNIPAEKLINLIAEGKTNAGPFFVFMCKFRTVTFLMFYILILVGLIMYNVLFV